MGDQERGFTIVDKRHERKDDPSDEPSPRHTGESAPEAPGQPLPRRLPAMDFATFLLSLSTSALHHLGLLTEEEGTASPEPDLPMARQTIDLLELLQEKTRGNLSDDEATLLENMLYELRLNFVEVQRNTGS